MGYLSKSFPKIGQALIPPAGFFKVPITPEMKTAARCERLEASNAEMLSALIDCSTELNRIKNSSIARDLVCEARAIILKAKGEGR